MPDISTIKRNQSFPRKCRLLTPAHYKEAFNKPNRVNGRDLVFFFKETSSDCPRLGLAVPKKQIKLAVERNLVKRLIRESFRTKKNLLVGLDIVVLVVRPMKKVNKEELRKNLEKQWLKLISYRKSD